MENLKCKNGPAACHTVNAYDCSECRWPWERNSLWISCIMLICIFSQMATADNDQDGSSLWWCSVSYWGSVRWQHPPKVLHPTTLIYSMSEWTQLVHDKSRLASCPCCCSWAPSGRRISNVPCSQRQCCWLTRRCVQIGHQETKKAVSLWISSLYTACDESNASRIICKFYGVGWVDSHMCTMRTEADSAHNPEELHCSEWWMSMCGSRVWAVTQKVLDPAADGWVKAQVQPVLKSVLDPELANSPVESPLTSNFRAKRPSLGQRLREVKGELKDVTDWPDRMKMNKSRMKMLAHCQSLLLLVSTPCFSTSLIFSRCPEQTEKSVYFTTSHERKHQCKRLVCILNPIQAPMCI